MKTVSYIHTHCVFGSTTEKHKETKFQSLCTISCNDPKQHTFQGQAKFFNNYDCVVMKNLKVKICYSQYWNVHKNTNHPYPCHKKIATHNNNKTK